MRNQPISTVMLLAVLGTFVLAAGCDQATSADQQALATSGAPIVAASSPDLNRDLAALRRLVAPFHNFNHAQAAGWSAPVTPCLEHPTDGGMGFHFGNPAYINDGGAVDVLQPELLLFEPQRNGQMRFVGVEYIVLFADRGPDQPAPELFGRQFHAVPDAGLWGLHAWVGRHNPSGTFADWNPLVSCQFAAP